MNRRTILKALAALPFVGLIGGGKKAEKFEPSQTLMGRPVVPTSSGGLIDVTEHTSAEIWYFCHPKGYVDKYEIKNGEWRKITGVGHA